MTENPRSTTAPGPGALTAVMRAASPPDAPRALRVGLVHRGRVIEERVFERGQHVTIGPNEHATFVVTGATLPPGYRLFESTREGFCLHLGPRMKGRLAGAAGVTDLAAPHPAPDTARAQSTFPLAPDARGRVQVGDHVLLFQLVTPTPKAPQRALPPDVKATFGEIDWRTSIVAAFSFLFHFGAVGSVYSDWMDPVVDDEVDTAQLLETVRQLPPAPPIEKPDESQATAAATAAATSAPNSPAKPSGPSGGRGASAGRGGAAGQSDARAHQLSSELARMEVHLLMGLNASAGSATQAVLGSGSDLPMGMLDKAAASSIGVGPGGIPGVNFGAGNAPIRPGTLSRGPIPGDPNPTPVPTTAGSAITVKPPAGNVSPAIPTIVGGELPDAPGIVAGMAPGFRRCYNQGLRNEDPTMKGSVRFTVKVGPNGGILSVSAASSGSLTPSVVGCMRNRVSSAQFGSPPGGGATLIIPVTVIPQ